MSAHRTVSSRCSRFFFLPACLTLTLALAACGGGSTSPEASKKDDPSAMKLAYGVSFRVPQGWKIDGMVTPEQATPAVLDQRADSGEPVMLVSLHRPADTPEGKNGIAAIFLVDAGRGFPPKDQAAAFTPEDLQKYAEAILARDKEDARKSKGQSNLLNWTVNKSQTDGRLTLTHKGMAKRPDGKLEIYDVNIYLDNGKGIGVKTLTDPDVPGNADQVRAFVDSIRIAR